MSWILKRGWGSGGDGGDGGEGEGGRVLLREDRALRNADTLPPCSVSLHPASPHLPIT